LDISITKANYIDRFKGTEKILKKIQMCFLNNKAIDEKKSQVAKKKLLFIQIENRAAYKMLLSIEKLYLRSTATNAMFHSITMLRTFFT
jgi:phage regulator Rha-like protein